MAYEENDEPSTEKAEDKDDKSDKDYDDDNQFVVEDLDKFATNIAEQMTQEQRDLLAKMVVEDTKKDLESREDMEARWAEWGRLYVGTPEQSQLGQRSGAPNLHTPGLSVAVDQFSARAAKYLLPPGKVSKPRGTGTEDANKAHRTSSVVNIQIENEIPKFRRTYSTTIKQSALFGTCALKTWWNGDGQHQEIQLVPAEDLIISHTHSGTLSDAERITHRMHLSRDKVRQRIREGTFHEDGWDLENECHHSNDTDGLQELRKETDGTSPSADDPGPLTIYEQHRYLDLDGDGIGEPYIATVHKESETLLRLVGRTVKNRQDGEEVEDFFVELPCDYNPLGFYSLGLGAKLEGLNKFQNSIANLIIFAALRNSFPPKFVSKKAFKSIGEKEYELDEWIEAEMHVDDMQKALMIAPTVPPSPVLKDMYQEADQQLHEAASITPILQGLNQPHNQAAQTSRIVQQESMEMFNGLFRNMLDALSELIDRLYQLNRLYLPTEKYVAILGQTGQPEQAAWEQAQAEWQAVIGQAQQIMQQGMPLPPQLYAALSKGPPPETWCSAEEDFADSVDIIPTADPNLTTEQERLSQSEAALALVMGGPEQASPRAIWAAKRYRLESLRFPASIISEILPEPQEPGPPPNLQPKEALAALLKGQPVAILPDQDHRAYIAELKTFKASPLYVDVMPQTKEAIERHVQERIAALIEQEAKRAAAAPPVPAFEGPGPMAAPIQNGGGDMGGPPGMPMVPGGTGAPAGGMPGPPAGMPGM